MKNTLGDYLIETYGENAIELYWSDKNILSPYDYTCGSRKSVWFKCAEKEYHEDYFSRVNHFTNNHRCPYCVGQKTHPKDSFAQWAIENIDKDFLNKYWGDTNILNPFLISKKSTSRIMIKCLKYEHHGEYDVMTNEFVAGNRCPYCTNKRTKKQDSIGIKFPKSIILFSKKNKIDIYKVAPFSYKKFWWKCENGIHEDYQRKPSDMVKLDFRCPECSKVNRESSLEKKTREFLIQNNYDVSCEHNCILVPKNPKTKQNMPFDNEVIALRLIIEVHGRQHYELINDSYPWLNNLTPEQYLHKRKLYDRYKKFIAHINNYNYLEIPYWEFEDETYQTTILTELKRIKGDNNNG